MERPAVGVAIFMWNENQQFILGKRKGAHAAGTWALPGGHVEAGESLETCCIREAKEETGLDIDHVQPMTFTNDIFPEDDKHYVTLYFMARVVGGELKTREEDKCEGWKLFTLDDEMPTPLFGELGSIIGHLNKMKAMHEAAMAAHGGGCGGCGKKDDEGNCEGCGE